MKINLFQIIFPGTNERDSICRYVKLPNYTDEPSSAILLTKIKKNLKRKVEESESEKRAKINDLHTLINGYNLKSLRIKPNSELEFGGELNLFPYSIYKNIESIENLNLIIKGSGNAKIFFNIYDKDKQFIKSYEEIFYDERKVLEIPLFDTKYPSDMTYISFSVASQKEGFFLEDAKYEATLKPVKTTKQKPFKTSLVLQIDSSQTSCQNTINYINAIYNFSNAMCRDDTVETPISSIIIIEDYTEKGFANFLLDSNYQSAIKKMENKIRHLKNKYNLPLETYLEIETFSKGLSNQNKASDLLVSFDLRIDASNLNTEILRRFITINYISKHTVFEYFDENNLAKMAVTKDVVAKCGHTLPFYSKWGGLEYKNRAKKKGFKIKKLPSCLTELTYFDNLMNQTSAKVEAKQPNNINSKSYDLEIYEKIVYLLLSKKEKTINREIINIYKSCKNSESLQKSLTKITKLQANNKRDVKKQIKLILKNYEKFQNRLTAQLPELTETKHLRKRFQNYSEINS